MGCGSSNDEVKNVNMKRKSDPGEVKIVKTLTAKQEAINNIFSKNIEKNENESFDAPAILEYTTPKLSLVRRAKAPERNVNLLIDDNTIVWDIST